MSFEQALARLGLLEDAGDQEVRKAYRKLAVLYHPDKNPEGRAEFELVQKAYQVLSKKGEAEAEAPGAGRTLELLMKTQAILYERCSTELAMYRYPCYQMLCALLEKEMQAGNDSMVCACAQVLAITAAVDPGNAQELVLTNGLTIVVDVLHRCRQHQLFAGPTASGQTAPFLAERQHSPPPRPRPDRGPRAPARRGHPTLRRSGPRYRQASSW